MCSQMVFIALLIGRVFHGIPLRSTGMRSHTCFFITLFTSLLDVLLYVSAMAADMKLYKLQDEVHGTRDR